MKPIVQSSVWLMAAILAFAMTGCASVPTGRYQAYSAANEDVRSVIANTDIRIEKRLRNFVVLTAPNKPITASTFSADVDGNNFDITSQLRSREAALDVLANYAKTLESLACKDLSSNVDKSAQDLAASLSGLPVTADMTTAAKALATVADGVAASVTESMRKNALRNAMTTAQPALEAISKLLQRDYDKIGKYVNVMHDRYIDHVNAVRPAYGTWQRYKCDTEVAADLEEFQQINEALAAASAAIQKLPAAHHQLLLSLDSKEPALDVLHDVVREGKRLRSFYRSIPSN